MKIINDTGYAKGYPSMNYGYCNPNTKEPYSNIQEANTVIKQHILTIPTGFTVCTIGDNKILEYWWDGSEWVLKVNGGAPGEPIPPDFDAVYQAISDGDEALRNEMSEILGDLENLKPLPAAIDNLEGRTTDNEEAIRNMQIQINDIEEGSGNPDEQETITYIESRTFTIYSTSNETPTGGSYNFTTKEFTYPTGWSTDIPNTESDIYFSTGTAYSDSNTINWNPPTLFLTGPDTIINRIKSSKTYPVQIYTSSATQPDTPQDGNDVVFNIGSKTVSCPQNSIWRTSPASSNQNEVNIDVWVSYNNYVIEDDSNSANPTGWTTPQLYMDIDGILYKASQEADSISQQNIENARLGLEQAVTNAENSLNYKKQQIDNALDQAANAKTTAESLYNEASDALSLAEQEIDSAKAQLELINSGKANVSGLVREVSELKGEIRNVGWAADTTVTITEWKLDGTTNNNIVVSKDPNQMKLTDIVNAGSFYYVISRIAEGQYKLYKCDNLGVKEVDANSNYISITYDNGTLTPNTTEITSELIGYGTQVTSNATYAEQMLNAAEGKILNSVKNVNSQAQTLKQALQEITADEIITKVDAAVLKDNNGNSTFNQSIQEITSDEVNTMVWGSSENPITGENRIAYAIQQMTKDSILTSLSSVEEDSIKTAVQTLTSDQFETRISDLENNTLNSTSFDMTPQAITLTAVEDTHIKYVAYTDSSCSTKICTFGGGDVLRESENGDYIEPTHEEKGTRSYVYTLDENDNKTYYTYNIKKDQWDPITPPGEEGTYDPNKVFVFNGFIKAEADGISAKGAMIQITKDSIVNDVSSNSSNAIRNAITKLTDDRYSTDITRLKNGIANSTTFNMTPQEVLLSAIESSDFKYELYDEKDGNKAIGDFTADKYVLIIEDGKQYFQCIDPDNTSCYQKYCVIHKLATQGDPTAKPYLEWATNKHQHNGYIIHKLKDGANVSGSFINMLKDKITLSVTKDPQNPDSTAYISLGFKDDNGETQTQTTSEITLSAAEVHVTGTMIANAIVSNGLNIANKTYLNSDGSVQMGMGTSGSSAFNKDGSGYLAGGLIHWGKPILLIYSNSTKTNCIDSIPVTINNGNVVYTSKSLTINGTSTQFLLARDDNDNNKFYLYYVNDGSNVYAVYDNGGWTTTSTKIYLYATLYEGSNLTVEGMIKANGGYIGGWAIDNQALVGSYNNQYITLMPSAIYSGNTAPDGTNQSSIGWCLQNSGSGWLASNKIKWNTLGNGNINDQFKWDGTMFTLQTSPYNGPNSDYNGQFIQIRGQSVNDTHNYEPTLEMGTYSLDNVNYQLTISPNKITLGATDNAQLWVQDDSSVNAISMKGGSSYATFNASGILLKNINNNAGALLAIGANDPRNNKLSGLTGSATNAIFMQAVNGTGNDKVQGYVLVNSTGVTVSNPVGGQILVDRKGVSINSTDSTSTPYIVLNNANTSNTNPSTIGIYSNSSGNRINVTSTDIQMLAGIDTASPTEAKSIEVIDSSGIRLFANASKSNGLWNSDVSQNINEKGIGLFANYTQTVNSTTNYKVSALIVSKGTGGLNPDNIDLATTKIESDSGVSSSGRVALVSANTSSNGYISSLNAFLSVNSDGIYGGGNNFRFGSNAGAKIYIQDNQPEAIIIGNVANPLSPQASDCFISFNKNGEVKLKGSGSNSWIVANSSGITIGADVKINASVTANKLLIADKTDSSITDFAGITGEKYKNALDKSNDDRVIWSGGSRESSPTFYVTRDGRIYGKEGTLSVINNNHITDYSNETSLNGLAGFIEDTNHNAYTSSTPVYKIDPSQLGDVVYLPKNPSATYITFVFPYGYWNENIAGDDKADVSLPLNNLRASVGKTIVFVIPYNSREKYKYTGDANYLEKIVYMGMNGTVTLKKSDNTDYTLDVHEQYEEDLVSFTGMDEAGFLKRLPNALIYKNPSQVYDFKSSASESTDTRVFTLTVGLGSFNGHEYIYSRILINDKCRSLDNI